MFNLLKSYIKNLLIKNAVSVMYDINSQLASEKLNRLKKTLNTFISNSFICGNHTSFTLEGNINKLKIGEDVVTRKYCNFLMHQGSSLIINNNVFFNNYCSINCLGYIEIGENTLFGEGVKIYDHNHKYNFKNDTLNVEREDFSIGRIKIGRNCWIGSNVTILNNVEIGDNSIIGANCLIYKSILPNSIIKAKIDYVR